MQSTQNSLKHFTTNKNLTMLWEVLLDELHINKSPNSSAIVQNIQTVFDGNISLFTTRANPNAGIMNLNKQFLNQVLIAVNQLFPNLKQEQQIKLINISDEVLEEPYKVEDIHSARQTNFEKQVTNKRLEFESSINVKKPPVVDFKDKTEPEIKITEMEALIAETMAKRKFDIDQIQNVNINTKASLIKKVSFDENKNITLHIEEIQNENEIDQLDTYNIFSKLKKTVNKETNIINHDVNDNNKDISQINIQINELNNKIDTILKMIEHVSTDLQKLMETNKDFGC
jgi:hypothetical protein